MGDRGKIVRVFGDYVIIIFYNLDIKKLRVKLFLGVKKFIFFVNRVMVGGYCFCFWLVVVFVFVWL